MCQNKAQTLNIRTARLPIGTYLAELPTRKVLTVNQVFQILAEYVARNDWRAAFEAVIPPRKFVVDYKAQKKAKKDARKASEVDEEQVGAPDAEELDDSLEPVAAE